jgi:hypothetical protein
MSDWASTEQRFNQQLARLDRAYAQLLRRNNHAITVNNPKVRSLGVHRLIQNYYKPSPAEQEQLRVLESQRGDVGAELSKMAYRPGIDDDCYAQFFHGIAEYTVQKADFAMSIDDTLREQFDIHGIGQAEMMVGSPSIFIDELPQAGSAQVHPVGAIDRLRYNRRSQKLCLVELKSPEFGEKFNRSVTMRSLHLKQTVAKQLTFYAWLFLAMCQESGVDFTPLNIELYIVIANRGRKQVAIWRMDYSPHTFLGGVWESQRWHGFLPGHLHVAGPVCTRCKKGAAVVQSENDPSQLLCIDCIPCATGCGQMAKRSDAMDRYFCSAECWRRYYDKV